MLFPRRTWAGIEDGSITLAFRRWERPRARPRGAGDVYRVAFHFAGEDPRIALRRARHLADAEWAELVSRLDRLDRMSRHGPWTRETLRLIRDRPEVAAADLAAEVGRGRLPFKG